jgi:anti-anti-sigma factor
VLCWRPDAITVVLGTERILAAPEITPGDAVPPLTVALVPTPNQLVVRLTGESDLSTAGLLTEALRRAEGHGTRVVVVDVARARFWDCSGLHALADLTARLRADDRQCRLVGATAPTRRLIAMADFSAALELDGPVATPAPAGIAPRRRRPWARALTERAVGGVELAGRPAG